MSCAPARTTEAPWALADSSQLSNNQTTYGASYQSTQGSVPPRAIRPTAQHPWLSNEKMQTRSTSQDAFTGMNGGPRQSCKPIREYEPIAWPSKPMTTNMAMFMEHFGAQKRQPYRPARKEAEYSKFETRSTQQDSYRSPNVLHPRKPIYPDEKQWEYIPFDHTSTSRAAYVAHMVTPFVAAQKPKASLNGFS